jgi:hypothetical protein
MRDRVQIGRALMRAGVGLAVGVLLGVAAWGEGRVPVLALALPLLVMFSRSRLQAFCVAFGYSLGLTRYHVAFVAGWFHDDLRVGAAAMLLVALITGTVWCAGWSSSRRLLVRALAITAAWLLALAMNAGVPGHPVIAAGYLLPGTGWLGVALSIAYPWLALILVRAIPQARVRYAAGGAFGLMLALGGVLLYQAPAGGPVRGIQPERTHWGLLNGEDDALSRMQRMGSATPHPSAATVVWPESIIGRYDPAMYQVLDLEVLRPSRRAGRTQIIGMDIPLPGNRELNSAVAFYPDGTTATATARQPAPLSLWRPWRTTDTFVANWAAHNVLQLGQGDRAAVIFCYEEYMPVLYLLNEALDHPTVYLAMANTWAAKDHEAAAIQTWHSFGMARLFGRPYIKAENRPTASTRP